MVTLRLFEQRRQKAVSVTVSALSDLLTHHLRGRSVRQIGREVAKHGVGESTVIPYFNGKHGTNPSEEVLEALALVMPLDIRLLRSAAGVPRGENEAYQPPAEFNRLTFAQRALLDEFVRSLVAPPAERKSPPKSPSFRVIDGGDEGPPLHHADAARTEDDPKEDPSLQ